MRGKRTTRGRSKAPRIPIETSSRTFDLITTQRRRRLIARGRLGNDRRSDGSKATKMPYGKRRRIWRQNKPEARRQLRLRHWARRGT